MKKVYAIKVIYYMNSGKDTNISDEAYDSYEKAKEFCEKRGSYNKEDNSWWDKANDTLSIEYKIIDLQVV